MVIGLGIDIVDIDRIAAKISKENGFRELVFSENEINYCETRKNKFEHYAARFAAKEAFFKALGTGWPEGTLYNEIEIKNTDTGKPELLLLGSTLTTIGLLNIGNILVSLSHIKTTATAVVILEK